MENYNLIVDLIKKYDNITIFRHQRPDGDAAGSQLGLKTWILDNFDNKNVYAIGNETFDIYPFVDEQISLLVSEINDAMQNIPPELLADAADHGICICGGGSLIFNIAQRLDEETNIRCEVVDEPTLAKVKGLGKLLKNDKLLEENGYRFIFKDEIREKIRRLDSKNI